MLRKKILPFAALAGLALAAGSAHGALLVYEGFDYTDVGDKLVGKGGTTDSGLAGTWVDAASSTNDMYLKEGSLEYGDLATSGNHIGYSSNLDNDVYNRQFSTSVTTSFGDTGVANGSLYFSFLFEVLQSNNNANREGFALMNGVLPASRFDGSNNPGAADRHGFAVAAVGSSNLSAVTFDGTSATRTVSAGTIPISVVNGSTNTSTSNVAVNFIVGEILFNQGTDGADIFNLYYATGGSLDYGPWSGGDYGDFVLAATIEADVDESTLDTLNLTRQVNVNYDEIRIGTTLDSVIVQVPEPAAALLGSFGLLCLLRRRR